ncbi:hypothetical protein P3S67_012700 [Capsicum chacoense]
MVNAARKLICDLNGSTDRDYSRVSLAAAARIVEADEFMRDDKYEGWFPHLFGENLRKGHTIGVIWAGPIGLAYARMMGSFGNNLYLHLRGQKFGLEKEVEASLQYLRGKILIFF